MPAEIDTVLFDLDGTLVEYERSTGEVLDIAFESLAELADPPWFG